MFFFRKIRYIFYILIGFSLLTLFLLTVNVFLSPRFFNYLVYVGNIPSRYIQKISFQKMDCLFNDQLKSFIFDDINDVHVKENSIFFMETSCSHTNGLRLSLRQACSIESAAKMNPNTQVYVLIISSVENATRSSVVSTLGEYSNVAIVQVNLMRYFKGTPLYKFYEDDEILTSLWPLSHMSDLLRYVTLYKYGGTYLDLDVIVIKSLDGLQNYAGAESSINVAAGVLNLEKDFWLSKSAMLELKTNFKGSEWGANGPGVITRILKKDCNPKSYLHNMVNCKGFSVYPPKSFYPISWMEWKDYFNASDSDTIMKRFEESYAIHVWNAFSKHELVRLDSNQPYAQMAKQFCPKIVRLAGDKF